MKHRTSPYAARTEGERLRNLARLGRRWQENPTPEPRETDAVRLRRAWWSGFWWGWLWFAKWMVLLTCGLFLSGCMDVAQWQLRTFYGLDCRQEVLDRNQGKCVPVKKGGSDVHTAQP